LDALGGLDLEAPLIRRGRLLGKTKTSEAQEREKPRKDR